MFLFLFFSQFSYCSKYHVNLITGSGAMKIFYVRALIKSSENKETPNWIPKGLNDKAFKLSISPILNNNILICSTKRLLTYHHFQKNISSFYIYSFSLFCNMLLLYDFSVIIFLFVLFSYCIVVKE